ncbi:hypothetical protein V8E36_000193 [Tilletia maclaganii]
MSSSISSPRIPTSSIHSSSQPFDHLLVLTRQVEPTSCAPFTAHLRSLSVSSLAAMQKISSRSSALAISLASLLTTSSHLSEAPFKGLHLVTQPPAGVCLAVDVDVRVSSRLSSPCSPGAARYLLLLIITLPILNPLQCRLALRARRWDRRPRKIGIVRIYVQVRLEAGKGFDEAAITPELRARPRGGKQGLLAVRDQCPMADQRAHRAQLWLETTTASSWRVTLARTLPAGCRQARRCATHDPTYDSERQIIAHQLVRTSAHFLRIVTMDPFATTETTIEEEFGEPFVGPRKT